MIEKSEKITKLLEDISRLERPEVCPDLTSDDYKNHVNMLNEHKKAIISLHKIRIKKLCNEIINNIT